MAGFSCRQLPRRGSDGAVGRRRGRLGWRSVPRTAWLVGRGSGVAGWLGGGGPPGGSGRGWPTRPLVGLVARVCRLCGGFFVPAALTAGARAGLSAGAGGVGPRLGAVTAWACTAGERGWPVTSGEPAPRTRIPTLCSLEGAERRDRRAGARDSRRYRRPRRACRPHPSPVPSPCRYGAHTPTDALGACRQPGTGNVTQPGPGHGECDVAVLFHGQRRIHRARAESVRRYRRRRRARRPGRRDGAAPRTRIPDASGSTGLSARFPTKTTADAKPAGHTLPPYPAHAVTAPRREPTAIAPPTDHARATSHSQPAGT
jgi:hypothetical protein